MLDSPPGGLSGVDEVPHPSGGSGGVLNGLLLAAVVVVGWLVERGVIFTIPDGGLVIGDASSREFPTANIKKKMINSGSIKSLKNIVS